MLDVNEIRERYKSFEENNISLGQIIALAKDVPALLDDKARMQSENAGLSKENAALVRALKGMNEWIICETCEHDDAEFVCMLRASARCDSDNKYVNWQLADRFKEEG